MKLLSFILAAFISFLTVQPAVTFIYAALTQQAEASYGGSCCEKEPAANSQKSDSNKHNAHDCCPHGICNPFVQCACCIGVTFEQPVYDYVASITLIEYILPTSVNYTTNYLTACFHPPEIV